MNVEHHRTQLPPPRILRTTTKRIGIDLKHAVRLVPAPETMTYAGRQFSNTDIGNAPSSVLMKSPPSDNLQLKTTIRNELVSSSLSCSPDVLEALKSASDANVIPEDGSSSSERDSSLPCAHGLEVDPLDSRFSEADSTSSLREDATRDIVAGKAEAIAVEPCPRTPSSSEQECRDSEKIPPDAESAKDLLRPLRAPEGIGSSGRGDQILLNAASHPATSTTSTVNTSTSSANSTSTKPGENLLNNNTLKVLNGHPTILRGHSVQSLETGGSMIVLPPGLAPPGTKVLILPVRRIQGFEGLQSLQLLSGGSQVSSEASTPRVQVPETSVLEEEVVVEELAEEGCVYEDQEESEEVIEADGETLIPLGGGHFMVMRGEAEEKKYEEQTLEEELAVIRKRKNLESGLLKKKRGTLGAGGRGRSRWSGILPTDSDVIFVCSQCGRRYQRQSTLVRHFRYECGVEKMHECRSCGMKFRHRFILKRHIAAVHPNQVFSSKDPQVVADLKATLERRRTDGKGSKAGGVAATLLAGRKRTPSCRTRDLEENAQAVQMLVSAESQEDVRQSSRVKEEVEGARTEREHARFVTSVLEAANVCSSSRESDAASMDT